MANLCIFWAIIWLIILLILAWPIAWFAAPFYVLFLPFEACCNCTKEITKFIFWIVTFPRLAAKNMVGGHPLICK